MHQLLMLLTIPGYNEPVIDLRLLVLWLCCKPLDMVYFNEIVRYFIINCGLDASCEQNRRIIIDQSKPSF